MTKRQKEVKERKREREKRNARLAQGRCPLHGTPMDLWSFGPKGDGHRTIVRCNRCVRIGIPTYAKHRELETGEIRCKLIDRWKWERAVKERDQSDLVASARRLMTAASYYLQPCEGVQ